jgi:hypothetical protein
MTLKDAIEKVLREARRPLSTDEICKRVLAKGLWHTNGKTPSATVGAQIYTSIKDGKNRFVKVGKGVFGLEGVKYAAVARQAQKGKMALAAGNEKVKKAGYVYILTNPSLKGMVKIGKTSNPVNTRSKQLYNTAIPTEFVEFASLKTSKYAQVEELVHRILTKLTRKRVNENREFYKIKPQEALEILTDVSRLLSTQDCSFNIPGETKKDKPQKKAVATKKPLRPKTPKSPSLPEGKGRWGNKTQLANLLAEHGGNPGSGGHLLLTLSGKRKCPVTSRWCPVLSSVGIKFDANDFVVDWTKAKNPLPWA